jgi:hypothetical protein
LKNAKMRRDLQKIRLSMSLALKDIFSEDELKEYLSDIAQV